MVNLTTSQKAKSKYGSLYRRSRRSQDREFLGIPSTSSIPQEDGDCLRKACSANSLQVSARLPRPLRQEHRIRRCGVLLGFLRDFHRSGTISCGNCAGEARERCGSGAYTSALPQKTGGPFRRFIAIRWIGMGLTFLSRVPSRARDLGAKGNRVLWACLFPISRSGALAVPCDLSDGYGLWPPILSGIVGEWRSHAGETALTERPGCNCGRGPWGANSGRRNSKPSESRGRWAHGPRPPALSPR